MEKDKFGYFIYGCGDDSVYIKSSGMGSLNETDALVVGEQIQGLIKKILDSASNNGKFGIKHVLIKPDKRNKFPDLPGYP